MKNELEQIEHILNETSLYFLASNRDPNKEIPNSVRKGRPELPKLEFYEIGPRSNYTVTRGPDATAIGVSRDSKRIYLQDVLIDGDPLLEGSRVAYSFRTTGVAEENGRIKIEGVLGEQIDLGLPNRGRNYSGASLGGYVKNSEVGLPEAIKSPDFDF